LLLLLLALLASRACPTLAAAHITLGSSSTCMERMGGWELVPSRLLLLLLPLDVVDVVPAAVAAAALSLVTPARCDRMAANTGWGAWLTCLCTVTSRVRSLVSLGWCTQS
jgi:uncharacterized membrane protein